MKSTNIQWLGIFLPRKFIKMGSGPRVQELEHKARSSATYEIGGFGQTGATKGPTTVCIAKT